MSYKLLGVGTNAKTIKGDGSEYLTAILYMTPYKVMVDGKSFNHALWLNKQAVLMRVYIQQDVASLAMFNQLDNARLNGFTRIDKHSWNN